MKVEVIDSIEQLLAYSRSWERLLLEMRNDVIALELEWITSWWKYLGSMCSLFVLMLVENLEVVGFCPLMITSRGVYSEIGFIGSGETGKADFVLSAAYREEALECICSYLRSLKGNYIIKFHGISESSPSFDLLLKQLIAQKIPFISNTNLSYYIRVKSSDYDAYFESRFSRSSIARFNKNEKKLRDLGKLVYKRITNAEMDDVFALHDKRWSRKIGDCSFSSLRKRDFYRELAQNNKTRFKTTVNVLTLNGRIISFIYCFEYGGKAVLFRIAHNDDFCFLSPGALICNKKIRECFCSNMESIDFGLGCEAFKANWSDEFDRISNIAFPSVGLTALAIFCIKYRLRIRLLNLLKRNKGLCSLAQRSLGKLKYSLSGTCIREKAAMLTKTIGARGLSKSVYIWIKGLVGRAAAFGRYEILEKSVFFRELPQWSLTVREATVDDLDALQEVMNELPDRIVRRFAYKHKCFITQDNGEIINYCWLSCGKIRLPDVNQSKTCGNYEVCIYENHMEKEYRNEDNYLYILGSIFNLLYKEGYKRCYAAVSCRGDFPGMSAYRKIFHTRYIAIYKKLLRAAELKLLEPDRKQR